MYLENLESCCEKNQDIIVSEENKRQHRAYNSTPPCDVRHYHLDENKNIFEEGKCCDYLLLNDTKKVAYFIEVEGKKIDVALAQLESTKDMLKDEIPRYKHQLRIVCSKVRTAKINSPAFRAAQKKYRSNLICKEVLLEECL